jgi:hypothetical protein
MALAVAGGTATHRAARTHLSDSGTVFGYATAGRNPSPSAPSPDACDNGGLLREPDVPSAQRVRSGPQFPWGLTFPVARAIQQPALQI